MGIIRAFLGGVNLQGWLGVIIGAALSVLLAIQTGKTHHWEHQANHYQLAYTQEQSAHRQTVINYQQAAEKARQEDAANKARVEAQQAAINQQRDATYEARIADARARADRLRQQLEQATAHPGSSPGAPVSGLPAAPSGPDGTSAEAGLPPEDALTATEQAIQLDELQKWVRQQHGIDVEGRHPQGSPGAGAVSGQQQTAPDRP
jgi:gas vesicle protein